MLLGVGVSMPATVIQFASLAASWALLLLTFHLPVTEAAMQGGTWTGFWNTQMQTKVLICKF